MTKSIVVKPKKRGRPPAGGRDPIIGFRADRNLRARVEAWMKVHAHRAASLSDALRRLVQIGLDASSSISTPAETIAEAEKVIAKRVPKKPSPARGEALLEKGLAEVALKKSGEVDQ